MASKPAFELKLVETAKDLRALIARRNRLERESADFTAKAARAKTEAAGLAVQIEEQKAQLASVALSDD